jgi:hypothetical protein
MYRTIWLMKRKDGVNAQQFREHYEASHRVLGEEMLNGYAVAYERNYLSPMTPDGTDPVYAVVTHLCFPDRSAYERCMADLMKNEDLVKRIAEDGRKFLMPGVTVHFESQDSYSKLQPLPPSDNMFRTVWFAKRRAGMSHEECRAYYENKHRLLGEYMMNGYAYNYDRHFLYKVGPTAPEPDYTFIMEMFFPSRARYEEMGKAIVGDPTVVKMVAEDEERFIDRSSAVHYSAEMVASKLKPLAKAA